MCDECHHLYVSQKNKYTNFFPFDSMREKGNYKVIINRKVRVAIFLNKSLKGLKINNSFKDY